MWLPIPSLKKNRGNGGGMVKQKRKKYVQRASLIMLAAACDAGLPYLGQASQPGSGFMRHSAGSAI